MFHRHRSSYIFRVHRHLNIYPSNSNLIFHLFPIYFTQGENSAVPDQGPGRPFPEDGRIPARMPIVVSAGYRRQNKFRGGIFSSRGRPGFGRELHERRGLRISGKERRETDERRTEHTAAYSSHAQEGGYEETKEISNVTRQEPKSFSNLLTMKGQ